MTAPEGWYEDPSIAGYVRYWDGAQWTPHTAVAQGGPGLVAPSDDYGPSSVLHYVVPVGRSWQSVTAPYLGLVSLVSLPIVGHAFGIAAITLGILALRRARSGGHGTGRAVVAIVLGSVGMVTSTLFLFALPAITGDAG